MNIKDIKQKPFNRKKTIVLSKKIREAELNMNKEVKKKFYEDFKWDLHTDKEKVWEYFEPLLKEYTPQSTESGEVKKDVPNYVDWSIKTLKNILSARKLAGMSKEYCEGFEDCIEDLENIQDNPTTPIDMAVSSEFAQNAKEIMKRQMKGPVDSKPEHKSIEELKKVERDYEVQLKRKEWKKLSELEKRLFEWFKKELNGDEACSAMFAVDIYEEVIKPHLNSRNLFPDKNKGFEKWANDWLHRFGKTNRSWLWDKYKDSLQSVIDGLGASTTTKNEGTLTLGMMEEAYNRAVASEELKTEMDNALKGNGIPDNSRNLLERFVEWAKNRKLSAYDTNVLINEYLTQQSLDKGDK